MVGRARARRRSSRSASRSSAGAARLALGQRRVHRGHVAVGRGRRRAQPAVGRRAVASRGTRASSSRSSRRTRPSGSSSRRSASGCSRTPCCRGASASSRASPCSAGACPAGRGDGDADRLGLRAPDVRPVPDDHARRLGAARGQDPALGLPHARRRDRHRRLALRARAACSHGGSTASSRARAAPALLARARQGLAIMRKPVPALKAASFQFLGWFCQLLAVWSAMRAFQIDEPLAAAGLVLVLMNVATIVPLWPGNVGLVQIAVATPLVNYGVAYAHGFAFGIGLQAIEASVGIGIGLIFLAREGLSYATLRDMDGTQRGHDGDRRGGGARACCALASPASLKGVLAPGRGGAAARRRAPPLASRRSRRRSPTAARARPTCCTRRSAASGGLPSSPIRSAAPSRPAGSSCRTAPPSSSRPRRSGCRASPAELDPLRATTQGVGELLLAALEDAPAELLVGVGGTATVDGGAGMRAVVGRRLDAAKCASPATCGTRCSASAEQRACSARRRARTPPASRSSSDAWPRSTTSRRSATYRAQARAAGSALRSRRSARSCRRGAARARHDRLRRSARAGPTLVVTGEGTVDATTFEGKAPGAVVRTVREAGRAVRALRRRRARRRAAHALSGDPARAAEDLRGARGRARARAARACVALRSCPARRRASPRRCGRALRRAPASFVSSSTPASPRSSRSTIDSSSLCASSKVGSVNGRSEAPGRDAHVELVAPASWAGERTSSSPRCTIA